MMGKFTTKFKMIKPASTIEPTHVPKTAEIKKHYGLPSPEQIAMLAATLAKGSVKKPEELVRAALKLWEAAERLHWCSILEYQNPDDEAEQLGNSPLRNVTREGFLREMLPDMRSEDRERAWKRYNLYLAGLDPNTATANQHEEARLKWVSPKIMVEKLETELRFRIWWDKFHAAEVRKLKSDAGKASAKKRAREEKSLKKKL